MTLFLWVTWWGGLPQAITSTVQLCLCALLHHSQTHNVLACTPDPPPYGHTHMCSLCTHLDTLPPPPTTDLQPFQAQSKQTEAAGRPCPRCQQ
jgi:hypothetical protein